MTSWSPNSRAGELTREICQALQAELDLPAGAVSADATFVDLGLDSAGVMVVSGDLSDRFGHEIAPESFFDHPTPRRLAGHLAAALSAAPDDRSGL